MEFNESESELLATMPRPPAVAMARVSNVWIIEWLPKGEQETGRQLFEWMQRRREGWATYRRCESKGEVLIAIEESEAFVRGTGQVPILHIEAHGAESGIVGPNGRGQLELLAWDDLNEPLQAVNLATGCNLLLYLAACLGYAGVQVFSRGPRAPALAIVGPDRTVWPNEVLEGAKEFYRRLQEGGANLQDILDSA